MEYIYNKNKKKEKKTPTGKTVKLTNKDFIKLCRFEKTELKNYLKKELKEYYKEVISKDGFLYAKGKDKIAVTAHMDTTPSVEYGKRKLVKNVYEYEQKNGEHIVYSPQGIGGDDRCGVYMIMEILKRTELRPTIVFCEDEEVGCIGSGKFTKSKYIKDLESMYFIIELDRRGKNDIVFYDDANDEFHGFVAETTGYIERWGSCSDISNICPACKISGVNLSCGYYNEHHDYETVNLNEMEHTLETTIELIKKGMKEKVSYEYQEKVYINYGLLNDRYTNYRTYSSYDEYKKYQYLGYETYNERLKEATEYYLYVEYDNGIGEKGIAEIEAETIADAWYKFFSEHEGIRMSDVMDYDEWDDTELYRNIK